MNRRVQAAGIGLVLLLAGAVVSASGPVGIYAVIDKVVFEPSEQAPERLQVWGAFAYVDGVPGALGISPVRRGYLYFQMPGGTDRTKANIRAEWADLKSMAGTGQAVGFGRWLYIGGFAALDPAQPFVTPMGIYGPSGGQRIDLRIRPASEAPANPVDYTTNVGVVKLTEASHAAIVRQLRDAPRQ
jgi:hypothetical protein